ncbi:MAG TPA: GerMN domain-containing protein [Patescibacteria group bacterium]|nr:GerMN domain-containing protein [Patescibacteria group bacterium]
MRDRPPVTHLLIIALALAALAAGAWFYTNASDAVDGIPDAAIGTVSDAAPADAASCEKAGGVWNECASACPPGAEACILMCVPKCEGIGDGKSVASAYYPNSKLDPKHLDCSVVFPIRKAFDAAGGEPRGALETLLKGPTDAEKESGYFTALPEGVEIRSFDVRGGVARVDFTAELGKVAGSCRVGAIRAQIEETLKQYSDIKSVVISVAGGDPAEALQP